MIETAAGTAELRIQRCIVFVLLILMGGNERLGKKCLVEKIKKGDGIAGWVMCLHFLRRTTKMRKIWMEEGEGLSLRRPQRESVNRRQQ